MNLSVGSIGVCAVMFSGYLMQGLGVPVAPAFLLAVLLGGALGWLNGFAIRALGRQFVRGDAGERKSFLRRDADSDARRTDQRAAAHRKRNRHLPDRRTCLPIASRFAVVLAVVALRLLSLLGRREGNARWPAPTRARPACGRPVNRAIVRSHIISGMLAAVAGLMVVVRVGAAMPAVGGEDWLLPLVSWTGTRRHGAGGRVRLGVRNVPGRRLVHHHSQRTACAQHRQFLAAAFSRVCFFSRRCWRNAIAASFRCKPDESGSEGSSALNGPVSG